MLEFVNELLDSQDNIIDQLKVLKENKKHKEVKKYINALIKINNSPYYKYCIDKYYFNKKVKEVELPLPTLKVPSYLKGSRKIEKLLKTKDNLIDQIKLLKEYKGNKIIDNYIKEYLELDLISEYEIYCIKKYYYDMELDEVKPTGKSLNITLYEIYVPIIHQVQEDERVRNYMKIIKKVNEGDRIKILDGPFKDIVGTIKLVGIDNLKIFVTIELFGMEYDIEHDGKFKIIKEDKDEK